MKTARGTIRGFTLVEVITATVIFGIIASGVYYMVQVAQRNRNHGLVLGEASVVASSVASMVQVRSLNGHPVSDTSFVESFGNRGFPVFISSQKVNTQYRCLKIIICSTSMDTLVTLELMQ